MQTKLLGASAALALVLLSALPADAQLIHRNRDGSLSINPLLCFTDYEVRQAVARQGFTHIFLNAPIEAHQRVRATRQGVVYLLDFNICSGRIVGMERLR